MECVTNPIFLVQINGVDLDGIRGRSGFRQGCPFSPYLFILCSQLLINAFFSKGRNLGIKVAHMSPSISHLLFADDILIFSNAKMKNLKRIKKITLDYCRWTGKQINFSKSSIIFNYLGIKIALRRLVAANFSKILEKAAFKLDIWGKKFISSMGRVVLIKSVIQAIHELYYSLSLVPMSILKRLDRMCRDFLWNKRNGNNGLHYVAWKDYENQKAMVVLVFIQL
ncbi:putative mitochondrial protein [Dendrobium catenatum]|uniref:Putative mitochondrial protein n=1 Tax=Dendrobium catenatum TaxID=906689 RepID=A0A2I0X185_9ASPA|nr:putative mitochondrial protein [Dendrobium catenatum]